MKLSQYMYGIIIVGVCVLVAYGVLGHLKGEENYNVAVDSEKYKEFYDNIDDITDDFNKSTHALQEVEEDKDARYQVGIVDLIGIGKNVVLGGVSAIGGSINMGYDLIVITLQETPIPEEMTPVLFAFVAIILFGIVFYMWTGREV